MPYTVAVTYDQAKAATLGNGGFKVITGNANITSYNSVKPVSVIGGEFRTLFRVVTDGVSDGGYIVRWDNTAKAFKAFYPAGVTLAAPVVTITGGQAAGPALQVTPDGNAGVLGKVAAGNDVIPGATFGIAAPVVTSGAGGEVANGVNVGNVNFIAFGV